jgi:hypothetical protein
MRKTIWILMMLPLTLSIVWGQGSAAQPAMSNMDTSAMKDASNANGDEAPGVGAEHAMHSMESRHVDMGPHMKMTSLHDFQPDDQERAAQIVASARLVAEKYRDYQVALNDGFKIFLPNVPQKQYHFTSRRNAIEAQFRFNPDHPTSLLYEKHGNEYKLIGLMYTAPKRMSEDDLNKRIPLSIAQWHEHVNLCMPPRDRRQEVWGPHPLFGLAGSISAKDACDAAGGKFFPVVFNWMVHVYPSENTPAEIWAVDRGHDHEHRE